MKRVFSILFCLSVLVSSVFTEDRSYVKFSGVDKEYWPYVNDDNVRVRTYPSIQHSKVITQYSTGKKVEVIEKTVNDKNELWYEIKIDDSVYGWMFGDYISFSEEYPASKLYERKFDAYGTFIEIFWNALYGIYAENNPYSAECVPV